MDILPLGLSSFRLRGKDAVVVTDPYDPDMVGLKFPKDTTSDIITVSHNHKDHNHTQAVKGVSEDPIVISGPGEYEAKGVEILGVATFHDTKGGSERGKNTVYKIEIDGISIVHCGDLGHKLGDSEIDQLDGVDVVLIPVGGFYSLDAETAASVVTQLEPRVVIPMHYQRPGLNQKVFSSLAPVSLFLKEMGKEGVTPVAKLKVTKDSLPQETQVVVLE